jgi:hypothetical protein
MNILLLFFLIVVLYIIITDNSTNKKKEHLYVRPHCDKIPKFKRQYKEGVHFSNYSDGFDCYKRCLDNIDCQYVGVGFDCYDSCFNNLYGDRRQNNTLGDYDQ